ncbi:hypothetical protein Verru16b_03192 [Lacunisphaera limnophila]|uniref:Uncharacterized protein n=1 Tax=Lacunisphaera limnophila TaxID=1838286 RepID=A0A1D8AYX7_9BACT|nr:hypothetical protein [Lacunisphaera limnophila]AOS46096.1 hypothetical protein Verru16b_03192 [Lacunisphaera limnophila]
MSTAKPTLLAQATDLQVKLVQIGAAEKNKELLQHFKGVHASLQQHFERTKDLLDTGELLENHELVPKDFLPRGKVSGLRKKVGILRKRLSESRSQLMAQNTWASCDKEAGELGDILDTKFRAIWAQYIRERTQKTEPFAPFKQMESCAEVLAEIERVAVELNQALAELPRSEADFAKIKKAEARIISLIAKLDLGDVPKSVEQFLKRASQSGVSLAELSDEVLEWLKDKKLTGNLRITTGTRPRV